MRGGGVDFESPLGPRYPQIGFVIENQSPLICEDIKVFVIAPISSHIVPPVFKSSHSNVITPMLKSSYFRMLTVERLLQEEQCGWEAGALSRWNARSILLAEITRSTSPPFSTIILTFTFTYFPFHVYTFTFMYIFTYFYTLPFTFLHKPS